MSIANRKKMILVVCGGNTCRSPMAKVILEQMLKGKGLERQFEVDSAAYRGPDGTSAHPNARETIKERYGADLLAHHVPKKLTDEMAEKADKVIVMEDYMKHRLYAQKRVVLGISDPYGQPVGGFQKCAQKMEQRFEKIWPDIIASVPLLSKTEDVSSVIHSPHSVSTGTGTTWVYDEVRRIAEKYEYGDNGWNKAHAEKVGYLTQSITHQLVEQHLIAVEPNYSLLAMAIALPHDIGRNPKAIKAIGDARMPHNLCSFKILQKEFKGSTLGQDEITIIQYCALFHTGDEWRDTPITGKPELDKLVKTWAGILRIADGLDRGLAQLVNDVTVINKGKEVLCKIVASTSCSEEIKYAQKKSDLLGTLGVNITVSI